MRMSQSSPGYESPQETAVKLKELGNLAFKGKRYDEALAYYEVATILNPTEISFYNNIAGIRLFLPVSSYYDSYDVSRVCA